MLLAHRGGLNALLRAAVTLPFTENYTGADGAAWPAGWTNFAGTATLAGNTGLLTADAGSYGGGREDFSAMPSVGDTNISGTVTGNAGSVEQYVYITIDGDGTPGIYAAQNGYSLLLAYNAAAASSQILLLKYVNNGSTTLATTAFTLDGTTTYNFRFQRVGTALNTRIWTGSSEPSAWTLSATDTGASLTGIAGVGVGNGNAATACSFHFDSITVTTQGSPGAVNGGGSSSPVRYTDQQPFAANSVWNTAMGSAASFESGSGAMTSKLQSGSCYINANNGYSIPVTIASTSDPTATITSSSPANSFTHRMPSNATIASGSDGNLDVVVGRYLYEYWQVTKNSDTSYSANSGYKVDLLGSGINTGIRAALFSTLGGLIRYEELQNSSITHALVMAIPLASAKHGYVWPASAEDWNGNSAYTGTIPMGTLFAIPGSVNLSGLGLTGEGLTLAKAMQDYGVYVGDTSGQVTLYAEPSVQANNGSGYNNMLADWQNKLRGQLRAVTNSTSTSVGGGGTPRQTAQAEPSVRAGSP